MKQNQEEAILSIDRDKDTEETPPEYPKDLFIKEKRTLSRGDLQNILFTCPCL